MKKTTITIEVPVKVDIYLPEEEGAKWTVASVHHSDLQVVQTFLDAKRLDKAELVGGKFRHYK